MTIRWSILVLLVCGGSGAVAGPPLPSVAVLDADAAPAPEWRAADRERLVRFRQLLAQGGSVRVLGEVEVDGFFAEPPDPKAASLIEQAHAHLAAGRQHSTRLKPDLAIQEYSAALRTLRAVFPSLPDLADLAEAHLQRGMTYQALGKDAEARAEYRMVLLLTPDRKLDEGLVNPLVVDRFEQVRTDLVTSLKGSVSLISTPAGARVFMNGRPVGRTPITIPGVLPGEHYFCLQHPGYQTWFGLLQVPPGGMAKQEVFLAEGQSMERWRVFQRMVAGSASAADVVSLTRGLGVDWLLLAAFSHPAGQTLLKLSAGRSSGEIEVLGVFPVEADRLAELAGKVRRWLAGDRTVFAGPVAIQPPGPIGPGQPAEPPAPAGPAWYERWWVWTLVGAVVVSAAATTTVLALDRASGIRVDVYR